MVLRRCAWHRRYFGYPVVCGIAGWGGRGVDFSDWMCRRCASRVRRDLGHGPSRHANLPLALWWDPFLLLPPAAAALLVAVMILVVTSPPEHRSPVITVPARRAPATLHAQTQPGAPGQTDVELTSASPAVQRIASAASPAPPARTPGRSLRHRFDSVGPLFAPASQAP